MHVGCSSFNTQHSWQSKSERFSLAVEKRCNGYVDTVLEPIDFFFFINFLDVAVACNS